MSTENLDVQLDQLVDKEQISYDEAFARLGVPAPRLRPVMAAAIEKRLADHEYFKEEFNQTGPLDTSPEAVQARIATNAAGRAAVEAALAEAKHNG